MDDIFGQRSTAVRLDWGPVGASACGAEVAVVVDVLSFSTAVTVAVERGCRVHPSPWSDDRARAIAAEHDAVLAVGRLEALREGTTVAHSLSPATLLEAEPVERLVLPSPNGSTIVAELVESGSTVVAGCLRNARAVAAHLARALEAGRSVGVIAAGERWRHDQSLRPALEDHLGAGAILAHLDSMGHGHHFSPEATAASAMFRSAGRELGRLLRDCVGGRELTEMGFAADVTVAGAVDESATVPVIVDGAFVDGGTP
ncbi:2-phosphosulfolactate phosphatase [Cellulomonas bogoriensis]|uniref:Probable 2-phosphosulfolactate phosphatase n=1 Tax=Cellulomonas bogoriensis 69B4 = DSM 16987 TaxID=1386082 RepID=A0A0A0BQB9_9CELL|nr:2-phosphosulfolactate phosphatase [Cellulomonas bogoriensis]KGM10166.1 2-phosphosulfolactate phosphatase [Cellulomonas bogoriensis 69B4 = DSM 16987]